MKRIDHVTALDGGLFTEGNPASGVPATVVTADWLNNVQEEIVNVIGAAGLALDGTDQTQLLEAIAYLIAEALPSSARIETDYIDASAMIPSDGSSAEVLETPTYGRRYSYRVLGASADDSLCITYPMPEAWDRGPVKAKVVWMPADGETVGNQLVMTLTAQARGNENFLDVGRQAGVTITDVAPGDDRLLISDASAALTVGGTLSGDRMIIFELVRDVDGGTTPMTGDARIIGLMIQYTCNQPVSAW